MGLLVQAERAYDSRYLARLAMPSTELTYEQFPHILEAGILTATTLPVAHAAPFA